MMRRWACFLILFISALPACVYERVVSDGWASLRNLSDTPEKRRSSTALQDSTTSPQRSSGWTILLETFEGSASQEQAIGLIRDLQQQTHTPDLWLRSQRGMVYVYRGRYGRPDDPQAENDLRQTRLLNVADQRPFSDAYLVPIGSVDGASSNPLDLRRFSGMYSLQVAVYDDAYGPDFRKAAEKAASALRSDGDEAYYYHGPHRSMVTIGLFTDSDFIQRGPVQGYGPRILELQEKYPYNLANGLTQIERSQRPVDGRATQFPCTGKLIRLTHTPLHLSNDPDHDEIGASKLLRMRFNVAWVSWRFLSMEFPLVL